MATKQDLSGASFVLLAVACGGLVTSDPAGEAGADPGGSGAAHLGGATSGGRAGRGGSETGGAAGSAGRSAVESVLAIPEDPALLVDTSFWDHPWPSDFRRDALGRLELSGFPNPQASALVAGYVDVVDGVLEGFSPAAAGYLRFTGPIDAASLPAGGTASVAPTSSVQLIDVDPLSPAVGQRQRIEVSFIASGDGYYADNTLAFQPSPGFPLRPGTLYALVVTDTLMARGVPVRACAELQGVLGTGAATGAEERVRVAWGRALEAVEGYAGVARASIVHFTVFTTDRPTQVTEALRDHVVNAFPSPTVLSLWLADESSGLDVYEGSYGPSPQFQQGEPPFLLEGGAIEFWQGSPGEPSTSDLRFVLSVPNAATCPEPPAGYPVAIYAHGTGGDYRSVLADGTAETLARGCVASFSIDQIFHGTRPGGPCAARGYLPPCNPLPESLAVFNTLNPTSMRFTNPQAAIDLVQQARLVTSGALAVPADVSRTGVRIDFDRRNVALRAHSQGAVSGVLALGVDDQLRGGALSGAAALVSLSLLGRSEPENLVELVATELYGTSSVALEPHHPALSLLQTALDIGDPVNYGRLVLAEPRAGGAPKSVLMVEGVGPGGESDGWVSSAAIEVNALAMGLPGLSPLVWSSGPLGESGARAVPLPPGGLRGNLAGGRATGALAQFAPPAGSDAHFVAFDVPEAAELITAFLATLGRDGTGTIGGR